MKNLRSNKINLDKDIFKHAIPGDLRMDRFYHMQKGCGNNITVNAKMFELNRNSESEPLQK